MRVATLLVCLLILATSAYADKVPVEYPNNSPVISDRQGGDTVDDATPINILPFSASGTTVGYVNDYDAVCPYTGSTAPDVVYSLVACDTGDLTINLCIDPTDYDTKLYVYDEFMNEIACNDDYCSVPVSYVSYLGVDNGETVPVVAGELYYIIIDGYSSSSGNYGLEITGLDCSTPTEDSSWGSVKGLYR